jgi:hypothetical protein
MQISIQVPDTLPMPHIQQRIQEFEASLQAEAADLNPHKNLKVLLMAMPNIGNDADFQRTYDLGRATNERFD